MKRISSLILVISFFSIVFYSGCKDTINSSDLNKIVIPSSNVSYSKYIQPVLNLYCATSGCHDESGRGGVILTTWSNTTVPPVVFLDHPETSHLVWVIEGKVPQHPILIYNLNANQDQGVKTWISEGAQNN
ncbi:MAG: hypothetical protein WB779_00985 [Ignavibacteriaceae bacterium]